MGWIAKQRGTMEIDRRPEPYLTSDMRDHLEREILPRYETRRGALLSTLHEVQHAHGWVPAQAMEEVADFLKLNPADVLDTASFYEEFWLEPKGEHVIAVCQSMACEVCDHKKIVDACRDKLGIEPGETTPDGKFTLIELECLGACGGAPAVLIDETLHESATADQIVSAIDPLLG